MPRRDQDSLRYSEGMEEEDFGRSRTWPLQDRTFQVPGKVLERILFIVVAATRGWGSDCVMRMWMNE